MTQTEIPSGAFFYAAVRRRVEVAFDDTLRTRTRHLIARHREIVETNVLPPPVKKKHCSSCSLQAICQPGAAGPRRTKDYFEELFS
jgi:CRISPR-associated exonuclease Cas4